MADVIVRHHDKRWFIDHGTHHFGPYKLRRDAMHQARHIAHNWGAKVRLKKRAPPVPRKHAPETRAHRVRCSHAGAVVVVQGKRAKWCGQCGAIYDGKTWHHAPYARLVRS